MRRLSLALAAALLVPIGSGSSLPSSHAAAADGAADFEHGLEKVRALMGRGKWDQARDELVELVGRHEGEAYVLGQRAALIDDLKSCAFHAGYEEPELQDLVSGEVQSYSRRSNRVKLRYTMDRLDDFVKLDEHVLLHPLVFEGAFSIEVTYERYPDDDLPWAVIGYDTEVPVKVVFGRRKTARGNVLAYLPGTISMREEDQAEYEVVAEEENPPLEPGEEVELGIRVKSGSVSVHADGRKYMTAKRKQGIYGQIALVGCNGENVESIVVQGDAQPAWFQGLLDAAEQAAFAEFEKDFVPDDYLPTWLMSSSPTTGDAAPEATPPYPGERRASQDPIYFELEAYLEADAVDEARAALRRLDEEPCTEEFRRYVESKVEAAAGHPEVAYELCERAHELDPGHRGTRFLLGTLLRRLERHDEAIAVFQDLWREQPSDGGAAAELARSYLYAARSDEARETVRAAIEDGIHPRDLEGIQTLLSRLERGPSWSRRFESRSRNYLVLSDIDQTVCADAANHLEASLRRFQRDLRRATEGGDRRYTVLLFSGQEGYQAYTEDLQGFRLESTAGWYSSAFQQLLIWNQPDREQMFLTIRHEGFHQYFDRLVPKSPPRWLNEGLAEYYEMIELSGGAWKQGIPNPDHLWLLEKREPIGLRDFVFIDDAGFFQDVGLSYAESWALVHFLLHGLPNRGIFDELIDTLVDGATAEEALERTFAGVDLEDLDRRFREQVCGL